MPGGLFVSKALSLAGLASGRQQKNEAPPERGLASTAPACTPDSVRAGASRPGPVPPSIWDRRRRRPRAAYPRPRAGTLRPAALAASADAVWPCTPWGLPSRGRRRPRWWALTPPFHPSPVPGSPPAIGWSVLCCTCRREAGGPAPRLPVRKHGALRCPDVPPRAPLAAPEAAARPARPQRTSGRRTVVRRPLERGVSSRWQRPPAGRASPRRRPRQRARRRR